MSTGLDTRLAAMTKTLVDRYDGVLDAGTVARYTAPAPSASAATVLAELGLTLDGAYPKPITADVLGAVDVVVIAGGGDAVARVPGPRYETWDLPHPPGSDLDGVRQVRDEIDRRVQALLTDLTTSTGATHE
jgi:protein-tyrosine-phosphatase